MRSFPSLAAILSLSNLVASQISVPVIDRSTRAINAPLNCNGNDTYMGVYRFNLSTPFNSERCADWCNTTSQYSIEHPPQDPSEPPKLCRFYNTYVLSNNSIPQEQVCAMYTQYWEPEVYAVNDGYWDGQGNHYTFSSSFFSSNTTDAANPICSADITELQQDDSVGSFCSSLISYSATSTVTTTRSTTIEACRPTETTARIRRDSGDGNDSGIRGVAAFYPEKFDAKATGDPVLVVIPAELLLSSGVYESASSLAVDALANDTPQATASTTSTSVAPVTKPITASKGSASSKGSTIFKGSTSSKGSLVQRQVGSLASEVIAPVLQILVPTPSVNVETVVVTATRIMFVTPSAVASASSLDESSSSLVNSALSGVSSDLSSVSSVTSSAGSASSLVSSDLSVDSSATSTVGSTTSSVGSTTSSVSSAPSTVESAAGILMAVSSLFGSLPAILTPSVVDSTSVADSTPVATPSLEVVDSPLFDPLPSLIVSTPSPTVLVTPSVLSTTSRGPIPTPSVFAGRESRELASVCSRIVNGSVTRTEEAVATFTDYSNCALHPSTCNEDAAPAQLIAGSFNSSTENIDDTYFAVDLDFPICIYDECSNRVFPSTNGLVSLGTQNVGINDYVNRPLPAENGVGVLSAFWDDLYIHRGERHYMDYLVCGSNGSRTVTFDWRIGRYSAPSNGPLYSWSATFYEDKPSRVFLKYFSTTDQGATAGVGIEGKANGTGEFFQYSFDTPNITNGLALVFDPRAPYFGPVDLEPGV